MRTPPPEKIAEAQRMRNEGASLAAIAIRLDVGPDTIKRWCDPVYARECNEYARKWRARHQPRTAPRQIGRPSNARRGHVRHQPVSLRAVADRDRTLECDASRSLTAVVMGDPLPGRSALDKRNAPAPSG